MAKRVAALCGVIASFAVFAAFASTASSSTLRVVGLAKEDNGSYCGNDCLAVAFTRATGVTISGAVSNYQYTCNAPGGVTLHINFGDDDGRFNCPREINHDFGGTGPTGTYLDYWVRHACPSGYYYSNTITVQFPSTDRSFADGVSQLRKPPGGCFTAAPSLGAQGTLAIAAGLGA